MQTVMYSNIAHCWQAVYGLLKEAEHRSTFYIPYWNLPLTRCAHSPWLSQQSACHAFSGGPDQVTFMARAVQSASTEDILGHA